MAPDQSWQALVNRVLGATASDLELSVLVAELRAENLRRGGCGRTFDVTLAAHAAWLVQSFPLKVTPVYPAGSGVQASRTGQSCGPMPWAELRTPEETKAWLSAASEEELDAMAARLLADVPLCPVEARVRGLVVSVAGASEAIWRRLIDAEQRASGRRFPSRKPESAAGDQQ